MYNSEQKWTSLSVSLQVYEDNPEKDTKESEKTQVEGSENVNGEAKTSQ